MGSFHFTALDPHRNHHKQQSEAGGGKGTLLSPSLLVAIPWTHRGARTYTYDH